MKKRGIAFIAALLFLGLWAGKAYWWDKRPQEVQESQLVGNVSLPDAPEASLTGANAVKLPLPTSKVVKLTGDETIIDWKIMAWQSQNGIVYANGGKETTEGSLFAKSNLHVKLIRQDDCIQSTQDLVKFCKDYQDNKSTPAVFITFMGSGIPSYITGISNAVKDLDDDYKPVFFLTTGKSYGEDQIMGNIKYKKNPENLKGAVLVGVMMDGDNDLAFKFCSENGIKVNADPTLYDPEALNLSYPKDFLQAVERYNSKTTETRKIVINGKTTGRDTAVYPDLVATWTPGDVNVIKDTKRGKSSVTIVSTKEYASIMPNITMTCKKWLDDHYEDAKQLTKMCAMAGDQIRSYEDVKKFACGLNASVYDEGDANFWYKYYNGVKIDENTHLGGSMVFNLLDMANIFGIEVKGKTNSTDIYKYVYNTFGTIQSKYYPKELPTYLPYEDARYIGPKGVTILEDIITEGVDKGDSTLIQGTANMIDYKNTTMTNKLSSRSYSIEFKTSSAVLTEESQDILLEVKQQLITSDGTKVSIVGHTDNTGDSQSNLQLSKERAEAVSEFLSTGSDIVERDRLSSDGRGDTEPIAPNTTTTGRAKNRRVTITLLTQ